MRVSFERCLHLVLASISGVSANYLHDLIQGIQAALAASSDGASPALLSHEPKCALPGEMQDALGLLIANKENT